MNAAERILQTHPIPEVETGIAMPAKRKYNKGERKQIDPSPWMAFLKARKVGESFIVGNFTIQYVQHKARELGIEVVTERVERCRTTRIWIHKITE